MVFIGSFSRVLRGYQTRQPAAGLKGQSWSGRVLSPAQSGHKGPLGLRGYLITYRPMACNVIILSQKSAWISSPTQFGYEADRLPGFTIEPAVSGFPALLFGLKERQKQKQKSKTSLSFSSFFFIPLTKRYFF